MKLAMLQTPTALKEASVSPEASVETRTRLVNRRAIILCALLASAATVVSAGSGYMTLYNDARSHLNIARHVTDSLTPGLAQLGSVWLPLPHLLMAPLAANDVLWHSGVAGAIVGGFAFVYSGVRLFGLVEEWTGSHIAAWCAMLAYALNLNLLYVQSTALTEPVLLACL
ncbi:MAG: hypothetical protein M3256_23550, partial [Actinomycetota bacterium]|nr:hypothetical protein [Actinomycetota bacterium]